MAFLVERRSSKIIKMKYSLYPLLLIIIISTVACSPKKSKVLQERPNDGLVQEVEIEIDTQITTANQEVDTHIEQKYNIVEYVKHPCHGKCAVFEFKIQNDGIAFYECKSQCYRYGEFYAYLGTEKLQEIKDYINNNQLMNLNHIYPVSGNPVPEIPLTTFSLSLSSSDNLSIKSYHHTPQSLLNFEKKLQEVIEEINWEKLN